MRTAGTVAVLFVAAIAALAQDTKAGLPAESTDHPLVSLQDKNKAVARRVFEEIFNRGKFQVADEIYASDFVNHGLHRDIGLREDQAAAQWEKTIMPDLTMAVDLIAAEGDLVTVVWTLRGTNTASVGWLPATGVKLEERGISVWRVVDGKIRDEWTTFDQLRIARQVATQLKWQLTGLLCAMIALAWLIGKLLRKLLRLP